MMKKRKKNLLIFICLLSVFAFMSLPHRVFAGPSDPPSKIQGKLLEIDEEEREVLKKLFEMEHEIQAIIDEEKVLLKDIEDLNKDIRGIEKKIYDEEKIFNKKRDALKQVLKIYQMKGPGSYIEIILNSEDIKMFLWRISTLKDLSKNTENVLKTIEDSKIKLSKEKEEMNIKLSSMENKKRLLEESRQKKSQLKAENEKYLASLREKRDHYKEQLSQIQKKWDELRILFSETIREFSNIINGGDLPLDAMKISIKTRGIEATIDEETFNKIASKYPHLSEMSFRFYSDRVEISIPEKNHMMSGTFEIVEGKILRFKPIEGSFYGIRLESFILEELFKEGYMELNLEPIIGKSVLNSVELNNGQLKFLIVPVF